MIHFQAPLKVEANYDHLVDLHGAGWQQDHGMIDPNNNSHSMHIEHWFVQSHASCVNREASAGGVVPLWIYATKHAVVLAHAEVPVPQSLPNAQPYIGEGFGKLGHCNQYFNVIERIRL